MLSKAERDEHWQRLTNVFKHVPAKMAFEDGVSTGPEIKHGTSLLSCVYSLDGTQILVAGGGRLPGCDSAIRGFDCATGREVLICRGHIHGVYQLAVQPGTGFIASASEDFSVILWNLESRDAIFLAGGDPIVKGCVSFADNRPLLAIGEKEAYEDHCNSAFVIDLISGKEVFRQKLKDAKEVVGLLLSADAETLIVAVGNRQGWPAGTELYCWSLAANSHGRGIGAALRGLFARDKAMGGTLLWKAVYNEFSLTVLRWLAGQERIIAATIADRGEHYSGACVLDPRSGKVLARREQAGIGANVAGSPDGKAVAIAYGEGGIELVQAADLSLIRRVADAPKPSGFCSVTFAHDGRELIAGTARGELQRIVA